MNLYSNKQKWKIVLMAVALILVAISLWASNSIVQRVSDRERIRARQWADAIKKKAELVEFTDRAFLQLREYERKRIKLWIDATTEISRPIPGDPNRNYDFPLSIINDNKDIPVIIADADNTVYGFNNLDFDTASIRPIWPEASKKELEKHFEDSLVKLAKSWAADHSVFKIEVVEGLTMSYFYTDSKRTIQLENERDSLIRAFNKDLIEDSRLVPVVLYDKDEERLIASNLPKKKTDSLHLQKTMTNLALINEPIVIRFDKNISLLYYDDSQELKLLQYYPYIQFLIIGLFVFIAYLMFNTFRKAEQNQVWAGMAKETAHQLGTPLSSLMAWVQLLETQEGMDANIIAEMQKDVERLDTVSQRFSKIGSDAQLQPADIRDTVEGVVTYLRPRISAKVKMDFIVQPKPITVRHNKALMEWVMENILKNAVDAMESSGAITVDVHTTAGWAHVDITDTGKGLLPKQFKTIFQPGYTTKKRGWGLGLSLVRRIVREYHKGKVFVLRSEPGKGTTFRISLPMN